MKQIMAGLVVLGLVSQAAPVLAEDSTLEQAGYGVGGTRADARTVDTTAVAAR